MGTKGHGNVWLTCCKEESGDRKDGKGAPWVRAQQGELAHDPDGAKLPGVPPTPPCKQPRAGHKAVFHHAFEGCHGGLQIQTQCGVNFFILESIRPRL